MFNFAMAIALAGGLAAQEGAKRVAEPNILIIDTFISVNSGDKIV